MSISVVDVAYPIPIKYFRGGTEWLAELFDSIEKYFIIFRPERIQNMPIVDFVKWLKHFSCKSHFESAAVECARTRD